MTDESGTATATAATRSATTLPQGEADTGYRKAAAFIGLWAVTAASLAALLRVGDPAKPLWEQPDYDAHLGYTVSLVVVYLPIAILIRWYLKSRDEFRLRAIMKAELQTVFVVGFAWLILDIFFANLFFVFPVPSAHLPPVIFGHIWRDDCATIWTLFRRTCYEPNIPIEELAFYLGSAFLLKLMYMWVTEDFFSKYAPPRALYEQEASRIGPLWQWNWKIAAFGPLFFFAVVLLKRVVMPFLFRQDFYNRHLAVDWNAVDGWPWYFMAQLIILFVPLSAFYTQVRRFTNPRGFLFLMAVTLLVSLAWEATLAIPYGWWGYQEDAMIGIVIRVWSSIPIEAPWLWASTGTSVVLVYEVAKIKALSGRRWPQVLWGVETWRQALGLLIGLGRQPA